MKILLSTLLCLLCLPLFGEREKRMSWEEPLVPVKLGVALNGLASGQGAALQAGLVSAAKRIAPEWDLDLQFSHRSPREPDPRAVQEALGRFFLEEVDCVLLQPVEHPVIERSMNLLHNAHIPFVTLGDDYLPEQSQAHVRADEEAAGRMAWEAMIATTQRRVGTMLVLAGDAQDVVANQRLSGLEAAASATDTAFTLDIRRHPSEIAAAITILTQAVEADFSGDLAGIILLDESTLQGAPLPWEPGKYTVVGVGATPPALSFMLAGQVDVLIDQDYFSIGEQSLLQALQVWRDGQAEEPRITVPPKMVRQENAPELLRRWNTWMQ